MAQLTGAEYFAPEYHTVEQILSQNINEARQNKDNVSSMLQKIWADWQKIWAFRIADNSEAVEL